MVTFWKQRPDVSRRCGAAEAVLQHKGRLRRAYESVFYRDDKSEILNCEQ